MKMSMKDPNLSPQLEKQIVAYTENYFDVSALVCYAFCQILLWMARNALISVEVLPGGIVPYYLYLCLSPSSN